MNRCDVDLAAPCPRVIPEIAANLRELIGKPVLATVGSMAFHGWLDAIDGDVLILRGTGWSRGIRAADVVRITESKRIPGDRSRSIASGPAKAPSRAVVADGPSRVCCRCRAATTSYTTESITLGWGGRRKFHTCSTCVAKVAS